MTLSQLIAETYTSDERARIVLCDDGTPAGQMVDYDAARYGHLEMTPTMPHLSADHVECVYASAIVDGDNGYRYQVRF